MVVSCLVTTELLALELDQSGRFLWLWVPVCLSIGWLLDSHNVLGWCELLVLPIIALLDQISLVLLELT